MSTAPADVRVIPEKPAGPLPAPAELKSREDRDDRSTGEVLDALSKDRPVTPTEASSALEWFLSEDPVEANAEPTHTIELNVGTPDNERWIVWTIRSVDIDELRRIQRVTNAQNRRNR